MFRKIIDIIRTTSNDSLASVDPSWHPESNDANKDQSSSKERSERSLSTDLVVQPSPRSPAGEATIRRIKCKMMWQHALRAGAILGKGLQNSTTDSLILEAEHWLEATEAKHRYGSNLRPYFDYWLTLQPDAGDTLSAAPPRLTDGPGGSSVAAAAARDGVLPPVTEAQAEGLGSDDSTTSSSQGAANLLHASSSVTDVDDGGRETLAGRVASTSAAIQPLVATYRTHERFFKWLDEGPGRFIDLADQGCPRTKLEAQTVKYLTPEERVLYEIVVDADTGLFKYKISGELVDTTERIDLNARQSLHGPMASAAAAAAAVASTGAAVAPAVAAAPPPSAAPMLAPAAAAAAAKAALTQSTPAPARSPSKHATATDTTSSAPAPFAADEVSLTNFSRPQTDTATTIATADCSSSAPGVKQGTANGTASASRTTSMNGTQDATAVPPVAGSFRRTSFADGAVRPAQLPPPPPEPAVLEGLFSESSAPVLASDLLAIERAAGGTSGCFARTSITDKSSRSGPALLPTLSAPTSLVGHAVEGSSRAPLLVGDLLVSDLLSAARQTSGTSGVFSVSGHSSFSEGGASRPVPLPPPPLKPTTLAHTLAPKTSAPLLVGDLLAAERTGAAGSFGRGSLGDGAFRPVQRAPPPTQAHAPPLSDLLAAELARGAEPSFSTAASSDAMDASVVGGTSSSNHVSPVVAAAAGRTLDGRPEDPDSQSDCLFCGAAGIAAARSALGATQSSPACATATHHGCSTSLPAGTGAMASPSARDALVSWPPNNCDASIPSEGQGARQGLEEGYDCPHHLLGELRSVSLPLPTAQHTQFSPRADLVRRYRLTSTGETTSPSGQRDAVFDISPSPRFSSFALDSCATIPDISWMDEAFFVPQQPSAVAPAAAGGTASEASHEGPAQHPAKLRRWSAAVERAGSLCHGSPRKWIYVVDTQKRMYVHYKHKGRFHHSSFLRGAPVLAAGNLVIEDGLLLKLTPDSGHYRPTAENFVWLEKHLRSLGADLSKATLTAKHVEL